MLGLVALALGLAAPACKPASKPACDEGGLRRAAEAFAARSREERQRGFEALGQACPTLPPALGRSLLGEFGLLRPDEHAMVLRERPDDPAWRELVERTCPRSSAEREQAVAAVDRDRARRASCRVDRYGLLAPNDAFIRRDLTSLMLYEWLTSARVDRAVARDVVWPLLSASASPEELEAMCAMEGQACEQVVAAWGLEPPRSSFDAPIRGGTRILVTPTQLAVDRTAVLSLHAGCPAPDAFVRHVSPALREILERNAERGRVDARAEGREWEARATITADLATPFATLADTLFTATKAGFSEAELVVFGVRELRAMPVSPPLSWFPRDPDRRRERPLELTFAVHRDSVEASVGRITDPTTVPNLPSCEPPPTGCHDLEAITAIAKDMKTQYPHETVATFRVDDDVPLQALVSLIDAVRGEDCRLLMAIEGEEIPAECLFWRAILDTDPPLHVHTDRAGSFTLGAAAVKRSKHHVSGGPSDAALLAAYDEARQEIQRCLGEQSTLVAALDDEDHLTVLYGRSADDPRRTTARVFLEGFVDDEPERCLLTALGAEPDRRVKPLEFLTAMQADLVIPTRFRPRSSATDD